MDTIMITEPSHTIVPTGSVYAPTTRTTHSPSSTTPHTREKTRSARRKAGDPSCSRAQAAG
jgi:hypothetical protein